LPRLSTPSLHNRAISWTSSGSTSAISLSILRRRSEMRIAGVPCDSLVTLVDRSQINPAPERRRAVHQLLAQIGAKQGLHRESHAGVALQKLADGLLRPRDVARRQQSFHRGGGRAAGNEADLANKISVFQLRHFFAIRLNSDHSVINQHHAVERLLLSCQNLALLGLQPLADAHQLHELERSEVLKERIVEFLLLFREANARALFDDDGNLHDVDDGK